MEMSWAEAQRRGYQILSVYDPGESIEPPQRAIKPDRVKRSETSSASLKSAARVRTGERQNATIANEAETEQPPDLMKGGHGLHYLKGWKRHTATLHLVYNPRGELKTCLIERNYDDKARVANTDETIESISNSLNSSRFDPEADNRWRNASDYAL